MEKRVGIITVLLIPRNLIAYVLLDFDQMIQDTLIVAAFLQNFAPIQHQLWVLKVQYSFLSILSVHMISFAADDNTPITTWQAVSYTSKTFKEFLKSFNMW